jgi:hypothetical protein
VIFKFRTFPFAMLGAGICLLFYAAVTVAVATRGGLGQGVFAGLVLLPVIIIASYGSFMVGMDLVVDDVGISRVFNGRKVQSLKWSDISSLRDSTMATPNGKFRRFFQVRPIRRGWVNLSPGGRITFSNQMDNFGVFVNLMNKYVHDYQIKIERIRDGEKLICNEISIT